MRILLYAGKGGVGKTSVAAATGVVAARQGLKTLIMSLDPAHSLSDVFDLDISLMSKSRGKPNNLAPNLWIQELDIYEEILENWGEFHSYLSQLFATTGVDDVLAEELAVMPGMEEISALLHINRYFNNKMYDLIILDCAPTAESLRFISLPQTLDWYMKKIFRLERNLVKIARPVAKRFYDVPLPEDRMFDSIERMHQRLHGADTLLTDPATTSVRLVCNPEKMVLRETQRAFMSFRLNGLSIDGVVINRILPSKDQSQFLGHWADVQSKYLDMAKEFFQPVPIFTAPLGNDEILGVDALGDFGQGIFGNTDPSQVLYQRQSMDFIRDDGCCCVKLHMPFAQKQDIDLAKVGDELIIRVGNIKRSIILPRAFAALEPTGAKLTNDELLVNLGETDD